MTNLIGQIINIKKKKNFIVNYINMKQRYRGYIEVDIIVEAKTKEQRDALAISEIEGIKQKIENVYIDSIYELPIGSIDKTKIK